MDQFSILPATPEDAPALMKMINSAYRGDAARQGWTHEADLIDGEVRTDETSLKELMLGPGAVLLKYISENRIVGCVFLQKQKEQMYLGMLTADPKKQGQGIGKKLLKAAEDYAAAQNCHTIVMTVISDRKELIDWYQRHGYHVTDERKPFPDDGRYGMPRKRLEFIVMKKVVRKVS